MGVIQLHKSYGSERLEKACKRAVDAEIYSYQRLKNILKNRLDLVESNSECPSFQSHIPCHSNTRGAKHYT